jgi:hypothetical protein
MFGFTFVAGKNDFRYIKYILMRLGRIDFDFGMKSNLKLGVEVFCRKSEL